MRAGFGALAFYPFLGLAWLVWACLPAGRRAAGLALASLVFVAALGQPWVLAALAGLALLTWAFGARIAGAPHWGLWGIVACLGTLIAARVALAADAGLALVGLVGVSYFTLQALSYLADVMLGAEPAAASPLDLWLYLAWFPKFMQGPFERFGTFRQELARSQAGPRAEDLRQGLLLLAWGLFEKVVVASRMESLSAVTFGRLDTARAFQVWGANYGFAAQLFADFSGYTDMARGISLLFGLRLSANFNAPFLAESVADFWRRWHISLSDWVKDYVFVPLQVWWRDWPLGGTLAALFVAYALVGLWHGAGLGFLIAGLLQALWMILSLLTRGWRKALWKSAGLERSAWRRSLDVALTLQLTCLTVLSFKAADAAGVRAVAAACARGWGAGWWRDLLEGLGGGKPAGEVAAAWGAVGALVLVHLLGRRIRLLESPAWLRYPSYAALALALLFFGRYFAATGFLYARF
ncbi:MAG TPA: MBOAT family O-acyltransferase [bacterium]|nr:MBOAT family O-acyltransferase [bacterium]HXC64828.1 MBOAT family O-acyltransferase [bacterium]